MKIEAKARLSAASVESFFAQAGLQPVMNRGHLEAQFSGHEVVDTLTRKFGARLYYQVVSPEKVPQRYWGYYWMIPGTDSIARMIGLGGDASKIIVYKRSEFPQDFYAKLKSYRIAK